mmetsp:Transcript_11781/g.16012  ORF Transcript_11781/g.16012 Transcript_11781/m.16012 type:complete len:83 (+) Transcript_11781:1925-2173(+)
MKEQAGADDDEQNDKDFFEPDHLKNMSKLKRAVTMVVDKQQKHEQETNQKMKEQIEHAQEEAFNRVIDNNQKMKDEIVANFR